MRTIKRTTKFKKDYKREMKGQHRATLDKDFMAVVRLLVSDEIMPIQYRDHALTNNWKDFRDCHVKPDLVLIYRKPDDETLELVRLGSHSELGI